MAYLVMSNEYISAAAMLGVLRAPLEEATVRFRASLVLKVSRHPRSVLVSLTRARRELLFFGLAAAAAAELDAIVSARSEAQRAHRGI